jgi:L-fuconolactonase
MNIDAHNHFWKYDLQRHGWIDEAMEVIRKDFLPDEFSEILQVNGFDGSVAIQADQSEAETHFLLELAKQHPNILGVVGWVDLRAKDVEGRLRYFSEFDKLVGFRHIVQDEPDPAFMLDPDFQKGLSLLKNHDFTYDVLIFPTQMESAYKTISMHPDQKFVIDHLAKPDIKNGILEPWSSWIRKIAAYDNVTCKLSGLVTEAVWQSWNHEDFYPYLDVVMEAFGTSRVMFGSDWPVCLLSGDYQEVFGIVSSYLKEFSKDEKEQIFGLNAASFYGISYE